MANHHWVPQSYLRQFELPEKPGEIYVYERGERHRNRRIRKVASRKGFNAFKDKTSGTIVDLEDVYTKWTDNEAPLVFKKIIGMEQLSLSDNERAIMSVFIANLITRGPKHRNIQKQFLKNRKEDFIRYMMDKEENSLADIQALPSIFANPITFEQASKIREEVLRDPEKYFDTNLDRSVEIMAPLIMAYDIARALILRQWRLLRSHGSKVFVTSDHPVSSVPPLEGSHRWAGGFLDELIYVALCPTKALLISGGSGFAETLELYDEVVDYFNWHTMFFAHDAVFSHASFQYIEDAFNKTKKGESDRILFYGEKG